MSAREPVHRTHFVARAVPADVYAIVTDFPAYPRLFPEIKRAFQFEVTQLERDIVVRYDAKEGGFFKPHRDNTTVATEHRRFAVTINLNAEEYEGGDLRFPEFGNSTYRATTGGAVVFSCSLLHEALPVRSGLRYCYLPFCYNAEDAKLRLEREAFLDTRFLGPDEKTVIYDNTPEAQRR